MSDGRKCWIGLTGNVSPFKVDGCEAFAFTLPELAARDSMIRYETFNAAFPNAATLVMKQGFNKGFAAGVEAAAQVTDRHAAFYRSQGLNSLALVHNEAVAIGKEARALLPPDYKSPAEIRREAMEEAATTVERKYVYDENGTASDAVRLIRALAEDEGGK